LKRSHLLSSRDGETIPTPNTLEPDRYHNWINLKLKTTTETTEIRLEYSKQMTRLPNNSMLAICGYEEITQLWRRLISKINAGDCLTTERW